MAAGADESATLHLPRILCLHGGGTNAHIFHMQCRVLVRTLCPYFCLVFAEAPLPARPGSDVTVAYKDYGPFKAWLPIRGEDPVHETQHIARRIESALEATRIADDCRGATGEWVGLLGFSQGAHLAASILANQQELLRRRTGDDTTILPNYQFGLPMPLGFVDASRRTVGIEREKQVFENAAPYVMQIPTIYVHVLADPNIGLHRRLLYQHCDPSSTALIGWGGDHRVPINSKGVSPAVQQIIAVTQQLGVLRCCIRYDR
ncbi:serine hydrolase FSH [Aspergillus taichungensis]|uniref:Serine hydrolase FSH n=1 Tax=Aspergillus taichungensis TaxID=482145 RepID=A0A2J5HVK4_9EURO|nr:serine hydrolase FSH [Aspergillus taichungensis]